MAVSIIVFAPGCKLAEADNAFEFSWYAIPTPFNFAVIPWFPFIPVTLAFSVNNDWFVVKLVFIGWLIEIAGASQFW